MVSSTTHKIQVQNRNDGFLLLLLVWIAILIAWAMYSLVFDILFSIPID